MENVFLIISFTYILLCISIIFTPMEARRSDWTAQWLLYVLLGNEAEDFVGYHMRRTALNLFLLSWLPLLYFVAIRLIYYGKVTQISTLWRVAEIGSGLLVLLVFLLIMCWRFKDWEYHPIYRTLGKYSTIPRSHRSVGNQVNREIRSNLLIYVMDSQADIYVTPNWIIKAGIYRVQFAHQELAELRVISLQFCQDPQYDGLHVVCIRVSTQIDVPDFSLRIDEHNYREFSNLMVRPIVIPPRLRQHFLLENFLHNFMAEIAQNPLVVYNGTVTEQCFACLEKPVNVIIQKRCNDVTRTGHARSGRRCQECNCRPYSCGNCLARWFSNRPAGLHRTNWLYQRATCPMCRARFCVRDVSYFITQSDEPPMLDQIN